MGEKIQIQFDIGCEGPLALNNNAFEICRDLIPQGERLFKRISRYDDYLTIIAKKPGHKAGDVLRLILPFLKAYGITNQSILKHSLETASLVPHAFHVFSLIISMGIKPYIIGASCEQYVGAVAQIFRIGKDQIFSTKLDLKSIPMPGDEERLMALLAGQIVHYPELKLPPEAKEFKELDSTTQSVIQAMDEIFWDVLPHTMVGKSIYAKVNPVGEKEKAEAILKIAEKTGKDLRNTIYIGDGIIDVEALEKIRSAGGLSVSFNGNRHAVNSAEIAIASSTAWPIALLTLVFERHHMTGIRRFTKSSNGDLKLSQWLPDLAPMLLTDLEDGLRSSRYFFYNSAVCDLKEALAASMNMRKELRETATAALG